MVHHITGYEDSLAMGSSYREHWSFETMDYHIVIDLQEITYVTRDYAVFGGYYTG